MFQISPCDTQSWSMTCCSTVGKTSQLFQIDEQHLSSMRIILGIADDKPALDLKSGLL